LNPRGRGVNGDCENAVRLPVVTETGAYVAPGGTVATRDVVPADITTAPTPPNRTMFDEGVALNPEPEIVTEIPGMPDEGEIDVMTGTPAHTGTMTNIMNATILFGINNPLNKSPPSHPLLRNARGGLTKNLHTT
jgi:hypothetical protein